ncbi:hypothetical protein DVQ46_01800 [Yersinia enterocolitica]|nr:hypothetical protein [Yersinia enterocolitica]
MEYKLFQYRLKGKYGFNSLVDESAYFLLARSMEDAKKQLKDIIHDRYDVYYVRECNFDELPAIVSEISKLRR